MFEYALLLVFPAAMAFAASMDLVTMTIPNRISLALVGGFMVAAAGTGLGFEAFLAHIATGVAVLAFGFALFAFRLVGGGDAKLLAAAALWIGHEAFLPYLFMVTMMGGGLSLAILTYRSLPVPEPLLREGWALRLHDKTVGVPYGLALTGAALWIFPSTPWFMSMAVL